MISAETPEDQAAIDRAVSAGQGHVFRWWDELARDRRRSLLRQVAGIDFDLLADLIARARSVRGAAAPVDGPEVQMAPAEYVPLPRTPEQAALDEQARSTGEETLRAGKVGALVVAGGQGTRLGFPKPKGMFPIGPVSRRTLFQVHADQIRALCRRYRVRIPWYIMTSPGTDGATRDCFQRNAWLGLPEEDVRLFVQGVMPAIDARSRLILEEKHRIFMSPNGHGGVIQALADEGMLDDMDARGIEEVFYFQVDNPLTRIAEPAFLGHHRRARAQMSCRGLMKRCPEEKLGVFGVVGGRLRVVEYSDLAARDMHARNEDGTLRYALGSPAIHIINVAFLRAMARPERRLPFHLARKKVSCIDETGARIEPTEPNGIKFERFVFDALPYATRWTIVEAARREEFSPVKNAEGEDSAATARRDMSNRFGAWIERAGMDVERDEEMNVTARIEINPLFALDEEEFRGKVRSGAPFDGSVYLTV